MKAWRVEITDDPDQGTLVVFANTRNEARGTTFLQGITREIAQAVIDHLNSVDSKL